MKASPSSKNEARGYEYFQDPEYTSFRNLRYNGRKDQFEEQVRDEWVPVKRSKCSAGKDLLSDGLITNIAYTSYQNWNADPEPSTIAPKSLTEQMAKSPKGRAEQMFAEEVVVETDTRNQEGLDEIEFDSSRRRIQELVDEGKLDTDKNGKPLNRGMNGAVLNRMKAVLENTVLRPEEGQPEEVRAEINTLLAKIEPALEAVEASERIARTLAELTELQQQTRNAIARKEYDALPYLNEKMVQTARTLHTELDYLRTSNPDRLVGIIRELRQQKQPLSPYKSAVIQFVRTHNTFKFSKEMEDRLRFGRVSDFIMALLKAYDTEKQEDDFNGFIAGVTRIPQKRLASLLQSTKRFEA